MGNQAVIIFATAMGAFLLVVTLLAKWEYWTQPRPDDDDLWIW
jgi:hypothetical protein